MFKYTAVIIEPRIHPAMEFVLENFLINLSNNWGFIIFHGTKNKQFIENIINNLKEFKNRIQLIELKTENLTSKQYNAICKNANFYKCINTEIILIFQTDTLILKENKDLINNFLEYDYVGAPWKNGLIGNGGLSLRKKSKMIEICEKVDPNFVENEDNYFCWQSYINLKQPTFEKAQTFSVETIFHEKSFGIHAPWKHLNKYEIEFLINKYPDIGKLIEFNNR
jgi:hypothetical protein